MRASVRPEFPTIIWKSNHSIDFKFGVCIYWVNVQNWFAFRPRWPNFGPLVAKNNWKWVKMLVSDRYPKSIDAIQFKLGLYTYWVSVHNWFTFGPCWPNLGPLVTTKLLKMVLSDHYLKKYSYNLWPNSNLVSTLIGWVYRINELNWWFLTVIWKSIHTIQSKLGVNTCWVSVYNWFAFGPCWLNFCPLVAKKINEIGLDCFTPHVGEPVGCGTD